MIEITLRGEQESVSEQDRLTELAYYQLLETPPEVAFERLTRLVARHFHMPIALMALVDVNRVWFKSRQGTTMTSMPRADSFCTHAIMQDDALVVNDTWRDERFAGLPCVTDAPEIRFYAGAPLITRPGCRLGTLCLMDQVPHPEFSVQDARELQEIAAIIVDAMELRMAQRRLGDDLFSMKKAQELLRQAGVSVQQTLEEKEKFIAGISNELRTPLNGLLGMAYLLEDTTLDQMQREYLDTISNTAENLVMLINNVIDLSKIDAGVLQIERQPFRIRESVEHVIRLMRPLAHGKQFPLVCEINENVPERFVGDAVRFEQILGNLLGNAIKFTSEGSVQLRLRAMPDGRSLRGEVIDTGSGIPQDMREQLFKRPLPGAVRNSGVGYGLAITRHLVHAQGGEIGFDSIEGKGSCFWFVLPLQKQEAKIISISAPQEGARMEAAQARVLIAEDHPVNKLFLEAMLKKFGFTQIDSVENGIAANEKVESIANPLSGKHYDVIFMDCSMPLRDGYEATRRIRELEKKAGQGAHAPILAITANALAGDREKCLHAGMDEYLSKPVLPQKLKDALDRWFTFPVNEKEKAKGMAGKDVISILDFARLDMVASTPDEKRALLALFFRIAAELLEKMEHVRKPDQYPQWKDAAHSLKGSASNLGMTALEICCHEAEHEKDPNEQRRKELLSQLKEEVSRVSLAVSQFDPSLMHSGDAA